MFDINKKVPVTYKYDVEWLDRPDLDVQINSWIMRLASISRMDQLANQFQGGHVHRRQ